MCSAEIAQLVEHFTRNEGVVGSSPIFSFEKKPWKFSVFKVFCFIVDQCLSDFRKKYAISWYTRKRPFSFRIS